MFSGGISALVHSLAAASVPAKVAVAATVSVGAVAAGAPVVATVSNAIAHEAPPSADGPPGAEAVASRATPPDRGRGRPTTTTSTTTTTTEVRPSSTTTTTEPRPPIQLRLWCGRQADGTTAVVCEWTTADDDAELLYAVLRDGAVVADLAPVDGDGMRWVDEHAPPTQAVYGVQVLSADRDVLGASNIVVVVEVTEADPAEEPTHITEPDEPATTTTTAAPKERPTEEPDDEPTWESIGLWCGRADGGSVVCEFGISEREDFGAYVLKRDGVPIWEYGQRTMPGRPWPDIRYVDAAAPAGTVSYAAYIVDAHGNWVGGSGSITLESTIAEPPVTEAPTTTTTEVESEWETLGIGCGRDGSTATTVYCEFSASQRDDFAFYVLKRDGEPILESADRHGQLFVDTAAPVAGASYQVYVMSQAGTWIGSSGAFTVPGA